MNSFELTEDHRERFINLLKRLKVIKLPSGKVSFQRVEMPQQRDHWSCGIHVLRAMRRIAQKKDIKSPKSDLGIKKFKVKFIQRIMEEYLVIITP